MTIVLPFTHRKNPDGSVDSICTRCFRTIASDHSEGKLIAHEERHLCDPNWVYSQTPSDSRQSTAARSSVQAQLAKS
jgi:hypothetical protein